MAHQKAAGGIEIGSNAIKAIRLERDDQTVRVADFCAIPHKKVLTTPDLDEDEMIRLSLGQLISQKNLEGEHLVMSVPGHSAFALISRWKAKSNPLPASVNWLRECRWRWNWPRPGSKI